VLRTSILTTGILVVDLIAAGLPSIAKPGQVIFTPRGIKTRLGGHSANVSIDLAKLGVPGREILLVGSVGDDLYSNFVEQTLKNYGVRVKLKRIKGVETSKNLILVVKGEDRRFHVDVGANVHLNPEEVVNTLMAERPRLFYVGATGMLGRFDYELARVLEAAKMSGCITFIDVIVPYEKEWDYLIPALKYVDIFHCNDLEAKSLSGKEELEEAVNVLRDEGVKLVVVTMGERGLYALHSKVAITMPAFKVEVIDPTGAGDAFCAGIMYWLWKQGFPDLDKLAEEELLEMLLLASAVGASATTAEGTTAGVTINFVNDLLSRQGELLKLSTVIERLN